jgi:hypothetical protein
MDELSEKYNREMSNTRRIFFLTACFISNSITEEEHTELDNLVNANDQNMQLFEHLSDEICYSNFIKGLRRHTENLYADILATRN